METFNNEPDSSYVMPSVQATIDPTSPVNSGGESARGNVKFKLKTVPWGAKPNPPLQAAIKTLSAINSGGKLGDDKFKLKGVP